MIADIPTVFSQLRADEARRIAVKERLRAQGVRVSLSASEIAERAIAYLEANPHLYEEALQRAWKLGMIDQAERIDKARYLMISAASLSTNPSCLLRRIGGPSRVAQDRPLILLEVFNTTSAIFRGSCLLFTF